MCEASLGRKLKCLSLKLVTQARFEEPDFPVSYLRQILSLVDNSLEMQGANSLWFSDVIPYMIARVQHDLSSGEGDCQLKRNIQQARLPAFPSSTLHKRTI